MMNWHIGCSGFHYKHWKGSFYPEDIPQRLWFDHYCRFFNTLELNVTFYRFPRLEQLREWHRKSPPGFRFAVKAPRAITHFKQFLNASGMLSDFYNTTTLGLQEKLGCLLFQMPARFAYSEDRLNRIISSLDHSLPNVLEFRNATWWNSEVYERLGQKNISFCGISHPDLPADIISNTPLLYYRFHGKEQLYASNYTENELEALANKIRTGKGIRESYIFFNNDINTFAVYNGMTLTKLVHIHI